MTTYTLYHNPRCSKSRQTLALLEARGIAPTIVEYLKTPPNAEAIGELLALLDLSPRALMRTKEEAYRENQLADVDDDDALIKAIADHPILLERPILVRDQEGQKRAIIGRPPENALELIDG